MHPLHRLASLVFLTFSTALLAQPSHPSLLLSKTGVAELKARIASTDFAKTSFDAMKKRVDGDLKQPIELPPRGQNWYHWYVCPKHGNRLNTGKQIGPYQWEHICPVDREVLKGDSSAPQTDYDGCRLSGNHHGFATQVLECGLVYQVTGDKKYAERAGQILLAYANKYADYPLHTIRNEKKIGGGKIGSQTLDESVWAITAAQGADLVWETLSPQDRRTIGDKLFGPMARDVILPHKMGVHNIQCWKNSAVGLIGFLLDDQQLIAAAIDDPRSGYRVQMEKGVLPDGQWWEGAWGYHFYTMSAAWPLAEAARNHNIDLYATKFKNLFDGPLNFARPDMVLPNFSDSGEVNLAGSASIYELGYARWKTPAYLSLVEKGGRADRMALLYGVEKLPAAQPAPLKSANFTEAGYAILTRPLPNAKPDQAPWICLKYGPHGGGHGHPDKLHFILYAAGQVLIPDAGITSYGSPLHGTWFRTTISHNTLVVDEANQKEATGKSLAFGAENGVDYAIADAGPIYKGVRFVRTAAVLSPDVIVLIDHIRAEAPRTLDIALHHRGKFVATARQPWPLPEKPGYKHFKDACIGDLSSDPISITREGAKNITGNLTFAADGPAQIITATGPGKNTADRVPAILVRRQAKDACIVTCISLDGLVRKAEIMSAQDSTGKPVVSSIAATVKLIGKDHTWTILSNPDKQNLGTTSAAFVVEKK